MFQMIWNLAYFVLFMWFWKSLTLPPPQKSRFLVFLIDHVTGVNALHWSTGLFDCGHIQTLLDRECVKLQIHLGATDLRGSKGNNEWRTQTVCMHEDCILQLFFSPTNVMMLSMGQIVGTKLRCILVETILTGWDVNNGEKVWCLRWDYRWESDSSEFQMVLIWLLIDTLIIWRHIWNIGMPFWILSTALYKGIKHLTKSMNVWLLKVVLGPGVCISH